MTAEAGEDALVEELLRVGVNAARTYKLHGAGDPNCPVREHYCGQDKADQHPDRCTECAGYAAVMAVLQSVRREWGWRLREWQPFAARWSQDEAEARREVSRFPESRALVTRIVTPWTVQP